VLRRCFPKLAEHMGEFLASTLFNTSALALRGAAFRRAIASYANVNSAFRSCVLLACGLRWR
jgi:5-methylthioribose kinase